MPDRTRFGPLGSSKREGPPISLTIDEYETIRLIDLESFTQEECALQMDVARTTIQGIYGEARKKLAQAIVEGQILQIQGGTYHLCEGKGTGCGRGCHKNTGRTTL